MTSIRRAIATFSLVAILSSFVVSTAVADTFKDVLPADGEVYTAVEALVANGSVTAGDTFAPNAPLTRGEAAKFLVVSAGYTLVDPAVATFPDVAKGTTYYKYVETAVANGIVTGFPDKSFKPAATVQRDQFAKMATLAFDLPMYTPATGTFTDVLKTDWFFSYVETAVKYGVVKGMTATTYAPANLITKGQGALMSYRATNVEVTEEEEETGDLEGGAGSIEDYSLISAYNNEEVGQGDEDVIVYGIEMEADDGSDLNVTAMKLVFDEGTGAGSDFEDYATEVSVWYGNDEIARLEASEFTDKSTPEWSKTVSFDEDAVIDAGEIGKFYVAVTAVDNLDSGDEGDEWDLDVTSVRFTDAQGAVISEDPTLAVVTFSFESFATANDIELKAALSSDSPDEGIVEVSETADTNGMLLVKGTLKATGSDMTFDTFPVTVVSTGSDVDELATMFTLKLDGEEVDNKQPVDGTDDDYATDTEVAACAGVACTITFDNLDYEIAEGDTVAFEVTVDINEIDGTTLTNGDTILAKMTSTAVEAMSAEDATGEDLTADEIAGSALGEAQHLFYQYAKVELVETPKFTAVVDNADVGTATFKVKVTAVGGDIYMNGVGETTAAKEAFILTTLGGGAGTSTLADPTYTVSGDYTTTNAGADNEYYTITEDESMTFTVTTTITQTVAATTVGVEIDNVQFGIAATDDTSRSALDLNWADFTDDYETPLVTLVP